MATDYVFRHHPRVPSTQDAVRALFDGTRPVVVSAEEQTAGRGRRGAAWENAPRAMAVSVGWKTSWPPETRPRLSLVAGLAARQIAGEEGYAVSLKWPNDVVVERGGELRKVGGILVETSDETVVVGFGLNLWWPEPPSEFGAVADEDPGADSVPILARRFAESLLGRAAAGPDAWGREEYRAGCTTLGREITWTSPGQPTGKPDAHGTAIDIEPGGGLMVETVHGTEVLTSGAVRHVRSVG